MKLTGLETTNPASPSSRLASDHDLLLSQEKVSAFIDQGPISLNDNTRKRKAVDVIDVARYRRGFIWGDKLHHNHISPAVLYTETAPPLPSPPLSLIEDPTIQASLRSLGGSVKVETPFNVDRFENLLHDHPNQPFVRSVMKGLREGFWPFDEGEWKLELEEVVGNYASDDIDLAAIRAFRDKEVAAGRWSDALPDSELLPGMKVSPMFVVWQNQKPRVVTDHSGSGLNDGIPRSDARVRYDDMHPFGQALREARKDNPGRRIVTFKSDVASAFLNLPAHPIWQLRQVVNIEGKLYIVRRLVFGNRASPRCWCAVSGLLCWIAVRKLDILGLHIYMDDFFGWDFADRLVFYHGRLRPQRQVQLLIFWEFVSCPFENRKQEHGDQLKIIGFWVDANQGSISLSPSSISDIVQKIEGFVSTKDRKPPLREWQRLGGHLNWLLNVLPWGRPALMELYRKTSGKSNAYRGIPINATVITNLSWLAAVIPRSTGIQFIDDGMWPDDEADMVFWTDASLRLALSFVYAGHGFIYKIQHPEKQIVDIFFLELVAIFSAIHHAAMLAHPPRRLLVWTDSLDAVGVFSSLHAAESMHNAPLLGVAEIILRSGIDLRVRHIEGKKNVRADMLSRLLLDEYAQKFPADHVCLFDPPRDLLPVRWRGCF